MDIHAEKIKNQLVKRKKKTNQDFFFQDRRSLTSTNKEIHIYYIYINCYYDYENIQKNVLVHI